MLNEREVAEIMKREIPRLLHARIAELEYQLEKMIVMAELYIESSDEVVNGMLPGVPLMIKQARESLEKEIV